MTKGNKRELKPCKTINLIQGKVEIWRGTISLKDAKPYSTSEGRYRYIEEVPPAPACHTLPHRHFWHWWKANNAPLWFLNSSQVHWEKPRSSHCYLCNLLLNDTLTIRKLSYNHQHMMRLGPCFLTLLASNIKPQLPSFHYLSVSNRHMQSCVHRANFWSSSQRCVEVWGP